MTPAFLLMVQAVTGSPPERIDLIAPVASTSCKSDTGGDEVVVCGGRDNPYRLRPLPPVSATASLPKAEMKIGNAKAAVETEQAGVGGFTSNRAMVRLKLPF